MLLNDLYARLLPPPLQVETLTLEDHGLTLAAGLGYGGLEVAPFTFGDDGWRMPAAKRAEVRRACSDAGIEVSGLHWLLAAPGARFSALTSIPIGRAD